MGAPALSARAGDLLAALAAMRVSKPARAYLANVVVTPRAGEWTIEHHDPGVRHLRYTVPDEQAQPGPAFVVDTAGLREVVAAMVRHLRPSGRASTLVTLRPDDDLAGAEVYACGTTIRVLAACPPADHPPMPALPPPGVDTAATVDVDTLARLVKTTAPAAGSAKQGTEAGSPLLHLHATIAGRTLLAVACNRRVIHEASAAAEVPVPTVVDGLIDQDVVLAVLKAKPRGPATLTLQAPGGRWTLTVGRWYAAGPHAPGSFPTHLPASVFAEEPTIGTVPAAELLGVVERALGLANAQQGDTLPRVDLTLTAGQVYVTLRSDDEAATDVGSVSWAQPGPGHPVTLRVDPRDLAVAVKAHGEQPVQVSVRSRHLRLVSPGLRTGVVTAPRDVV